MSLKSYRNSIWVNRLLLGLEHDMACPIHQRNR